MLPGTAAAKAGLKSGDIVTKLDGKAVAGQSDLSAIVDGKRPGEKLSVTYVRNGQAHTTEVTLGARPA